MNTFLSNIRKSLLGQILVLGMMFPGLGIFPMLSYANPAGGVVVHGNVNISGAGNQLNIHQGSNLAIINWQNFNISSGEVTQFFQPGSSAVALNRVVGGNMTEIAGALRANGGVFVINTNGIVVSSTGIIDVGGMTVLSTLDITNSDFLDGGAYRFTGKSGAGVANYGTITSRGGDVVMLGNFLRNAGSVNAPGGTVAFGAGGDIIVDQAGGSKISVLAAGPGGEVGIENSGEITAAAAELKAHGNVYALAIQNDGIVRANGYNFSGGKLTLSATGGGSVVNTGDLYARNSDGAGGAISVSGSSVKIGSGRVDASGTSSRSGGTVDIVADSVEIGTDAEIVADGLEGGSVTIGNGDSLEVAGKVSAQGLGLSGGSVDMTADDVLLAANSVTSVNGVTRGGNIRVGGGFQGKDDDINNATTLMVEEGATLEADSINGNAGTVILWSEDTTVFDGLVTATSINGNGGFVEISGAQNLGYYGLVDASSVNGRNGMLLLDPGAITISTAATTTGVAAGALQVINNTDLVNTLENSDVVLFTDGQGTGEIRVEADVIWGEDSNQGVLSLLAHGDVHILADVQGTGVNVVAGWDSDVALIPDFSAATDDEIWGVGTSADEIPGSVVIDGMTLFMASLETNMGFGVGSGDDGDVFVGFQSGRAVSIGSRYFDTNIYGKNIFVLDGGNADRYAQIGYRNAEKNPDADINVIAKENIILSAAETGTNGQNDSFVMIGHGGSNRASVQNGILSGNGDLSGDIRVISYGGGVELHGSNDRSFAQIGHGGYYLVGDKDGDITVIADYIQLRGGDVRGGADSSNRAGARIGHGGYDSPGSVDLTNDPNGVGYSGDIYVKARTSITGAVGNSVTNGNSGNYVQIGHGGFRSGVIGDYDATDDVVGPTVVIREDGATSQEDWHVSSTMEGHSGAIYVEAESGSIKFSAGGRSDGAVQIGHGGREAHGNHSNSLDDVNNTLTAERDGLKDGITVRAGGDILFERYVHPSVVRGASNSYVQIGNGGYWAGGRFSGDIDIELDGDFEMHGGEGAAAYAQVGHGGYMNNGNANGPHNRNGYATLSGDIRLVAGGHIRMFSGSDGNGSYSMIGHGGINRIADGLKPGGAYVDQVDAGHHGDIFIDAGEEIIMSGIPDPDGGLNDVAGSLNFTMIGHGGYRSPGDHYGKIEAYADTDITIQAGYSGWEGYRQWHPSNGTLRDRYEEDDTGAYNFAQIGHGGGESLLYSAGDLNNNGAATGNFYLFNGNDQGKGIGVAGDSSITVEATNGNFDLIAVNVQGSQREGADTHFENYDINTFDLTGTVVDVQLVVGEIVIVTGADHGLSAGDVVVLTSNTANGATGLDTEITTITFYVDEVTSPTSFVLGDPTHIPGSSDPDVPDDTPIDVNQVDLTMKDGTFGRSIVRPVITRALRSYAQVGHGGYGDNDTERMITPESEFVGNISVTAGGYINVKAGQIEQRDAIEEPGNVVSEDNIQYNHAMIGHGGQAVRAGNFEGTIDVIAGGDITMMGGMAFREFAKIGHGGYDSAVGTGAYTDTTMSGDIRVFSTGGNIHIEGGGLTNLDSFSLDYGQFSYAQIGHGANNRSQTIDAEITVSAFGNVEVLGGQGYRDAYGQIGHGGLHNTDGNFSGTIDVTAGSDVYLESRTGQNTYGFGADSVRNYAKIGHGDTDSSGRTKSEGEWNGNIYVKAGDDFTSYGGHVGHLDPTNGDGNLRSRTGETFLAVGRNNPFADNTTALFTTDADATFTSALLGSGAGKELRIYIPHPIGNEIAEGTLFNNWNYETDPVPDGTRSDEGIATEHTLMVNAVVDGGDGELVGTFLPEGDYLPNDFGGLYRIFYATTAPVQQSAGGVVFISSGPTVIGDFNFGAYSYMDLYDLFDRSDPQFEYDGYEDGLVFGITPGEASEGEDNQPSSSILEEILDGSFGSRRDYSAEDETDEDAQRRRLRASRKGGISSLVFYIFDPNTNQYSSFRVFGDPRSNVAASQ